MRTKTVETFKDGKLVSSETVSLPDIPLSAKMADTEAPGAVARKLEDVLDHLVNQKPLSQEAVAWLNSRKEKRK